MNQCTLYKWTDKRIDSPFYRDARMQLKLAKTGQNILSCNVLDGQQCQGQGTTKCGSTGAMLQGSEQSFRQQRKKKRGKQRGKKEGKRERERGKKKNKEKEKEVKTRETKRKSATKKKKIEKKRPEN